jgi:oligosaccharyltransferase complex subunit delta (ribophorin II)
LSLLFAFVILSFKMHLWQATVPFCLLAAATLPGAAASAWGFTDATVAVQHKGAGVNGGFKEQYVSQFNQANEC